MIEVVYNSNGLIKNTTLDKYNSADLTWINVFNPKEEDLSLISKKFGISISTLKHFLDNDEIPRIEKLKDHDIIILKFLVEKKVRTLGIVKGKNYVLTSCIENINIDIDKEVISKDSSYLLKFILNKLIRNFSLKLDSIEEEISHLEDIIFDEKKDKDNKEIYHLKKELIYIKKGLNSNKDVISEIEKIDDIKIELNQLIEVENTLSYRITEIMYLYMTYTSNKLNETMKSFTVIASLILLPSLIAGIYGMNLKIPLSDINGSFYIILGVMLFFMILMILYFKYEKWV
ncbi:MAG: CorA family divalent cation transporter [Nanoarchaeota archaeon]